MAKTKKNKPEQTFEASLKALEKLIAKMDSGELTLEEALERFEEGINLARACQKTLQEAEQKVFILTEKGATLEAKPWSESE